MSSRLVAAPGSDLHVDVGGVEAGTGTVESGVVRRTVCRAGVRSAVRARCVAARYSPPPTGRSYSSEFGPAATPRSGYGVLSRVTGPVSRCYVRPTTTGSDTPLRPDLAADAGLDPHRVVGRGDAVVHRAHTSPVLGTEVVNGKRLRPGHATAPGFQRRHGNPRVTAGPGGGDLRVLMPIRRYQGGCGGV